MADETTVDIMAAPLNVLLVEDSVDDADLVVEELRRGGFEPSWKRVETEPDFLRELKGGPDLIISDYSMPQFSGLRAVDCLRKSGLDIPFILVSGTIGEEAAVEAMKRGATDYLLKDRIARLGNAVEQALRQRQFRTEHKRMQQQLTLQATALETAANAIMVTDRAGRILWVNPAFTAYTGYTPEEVLGKTPRVLKSGQHDVAFFKNFWKTILSGQTWRGEFINRRKDGNLYFDEHTVTPVRGESGEITHFVGIMHDITQRKQAEAALRESEMRFRQLAENIDEVFWITDPVKTQMHYVSPAYEAIWGQSCASLLASPQAWLESVHPEDRERVRAAAHTKQAKGEYDETYRITRPDGSVHWIRDRAFPILDAAGNIYRIVGTATDITGERNLEQQLRHMQKMESIGQLAAGVAHDFNNILTVIRTNAELGLMDVKHVTAPLVEYLKQIAAASERAASLTRHLLTFAHKQVMQLQRLDLNEVVSNMLKMLKRILGEDITLQVSYGSDLPTVRADVGMLEQVIMNLAVNARDAMPHGGRLIISTADVQIDEGYVQLNPQSTTGAYVSLSVSDTGSGIHPEIRSRIFDPFFTTKGVGKGTGLGLATVYGILRQHNGWVTVYSEVGQGAVFRIYLPAVEARAKEKVQRETAPEAMGGTETLLLVEDEAAVRALFRNVLERYGYTVIEAESGVKALGYWNAHRDEIDLVLTDIVMPDGVTGRKLAEEIHAQRPGLPVIYLSGYSADVVGKDFKLDEGVNFLQKPCATSQLALAVRRCLDRTSV